MQFSRKDMSCISIFDEMPQELYYGFALVACGTPWMQFPIDVLITRFEMFCIMCICRYFVVVIVEYAFRKEIFALNRFNITIRLNNRECHRFSELDGWLVC